MSKNSITYSDVRDFADHGDGTFILVRSVDADGCPISYLEHYYPAPEFGTRRGYAVALGPLFTNDDEPVEIPEGGLIGTWWDEERGTYHVDRVVQVKGSREDALAIAKQFNQLSIYDFHTGEVIYL